MSYYSEKAVCFVYEAANQTVCKVIKNECSYAEKNVTVKVVFELQEYKGTNADGSANWVSVKPIEGSYTVKVGRVDNAMTKVTEFFEGILNFLLNTVPAFLAEALKSDVWGRMFELLGSIGGKLGG